MKTLSILECTRSAFSKKEKDYLRSTLSRRQLQGFVGRIEAYGAVHAAHVQFALPRNFGSAKGKKPSMRRNNMKQELERMCCEIEKKPPRIVFSRHATRENMMDAVAGELLFATRRFVGAHATRSIDPPAEGQSHSEARIQAIVTLVMANAAELFNPHVQINKLMDAVLARREQFRRKQSV